MKKKDKKLLKVLLVFFVVFSMLLSDCAPVLAATIDAASELAQNIEEQEKVSVEEEKTKTEAVEVEAEKTEEKIETEAVEVETETETELDVENNKFIVSTNVDEPAAETIKTISKLNTEYTSVDGNTYEVTVSYGKDSKIPENAKLSVKEFAKETKEYEDALNTVISDKKEKGKEDELNSFEMVALDISILDENGTEIEPDDSVTVEINIKSLPGVEDLSEVVDTLEIQHHVEEQGKTTIDSLEYNPEYNENKKEIKTIFNVESFSTFTITWRGNTTTIHYGYMEGNSFIEFANQPSPVNVTTNHHAYLIYDFDGYHYSGNTYYRTNQSTNPSSNGGTKIQAMLRYNDQYGSSNDNWQYRGTSNNSNWTTIGNNSHIYVVYEKNQAITQGGTPTPKQDGTPLDAPDILKESEDQEDGTRILSLSVTGHTKQLEVEKLADVIVVFDVSGSMNNDMNGNTTYNNNNRRLTIAKNAVNNMANTLSTKVNSNGDKLIRMGLISFSNTAKVEQELTNSYGTAASDFNGAVSGLTAGGGTNWEQALKLANEMAVDSGRATFVIFVSDGDPTFRISRMNANDAQLDILNKDDDTSINYSNNQFYLSDNLFGTGSTDPSSYNYNAALAQAKAIKNANKSFYTIGISNDVTNMNKLNTDAGGNGSYTATSSTQLENAFNSIIESMEGTLGWNAGIIDGVTGLTNLTAKSPIVGVDENSFTYYRNDVEWNPTEHGANEAS